MALCRALELRLDPGYKVDVSPVAETALDKLGPEPPDLIVTDLCMPGMGGLAFIRQVREANPQTRTLLITAFGSPQVEETARRLGASYLSKPFTLQTFVTTVERILNQAGEEGEGQGRVEPGDTRQGTHARVH